MIAEEQGTKECGGPAKKRGGHVTPSFQLMMSRITIKLQLKVSFV
jgi:hypothetical protein